MLMKNNKGTILVVAVVCMSIMIIIGFVCLKIYSNQSILDTRDVVKQKLYYSAIGGIEAAKGFLAEKVAEEIRSHIGQESNQGDVGTVGNPGNGIIFQLVSNSGNNYRPFEEEGNTLFENNVFDGTMYPAIIVHVSIQRLAAAPAGIFYFRNGATTAFPAGVTGTALNAANKSYVITSQATTSLSSALSNGGTMTVTARFYFWTQGNSVDIGGGFRSFSNTIHTVGWRID